LLLLAFGAVVVVVLCVVFGGMYARVFPSPARSLARSSFLLAAAGIEMGSKQELSDAVSTSSRSVRC
jgi:hypothetical protein